MRAKHRILGHAAALISVLSVMWVAVTCLLAPSSAYARSTPHTTAEKTVSLPGINSQADLNSWIKLGSDAAGEWAYGTGPWDSSAVFERINGDLSGFYNPNANYGKMKIWCNVTTTPDAGGWLDDDFVGMMFHTKATSGGMSTYMFVLSGKGGDAGNDKWIWPNAGQTVTDATARNTTGLYKITNAGWSSGNVSLLKLSSQNWTAFSNSAYKHIEITIEPVSTGQHIVIKYAGTTVVDYTDTSNPIDTGSYGFWCLSQGYTYFKDIGGEVERAEYKVNYQANGKGATLSTGGSSYTSYELSTWKYDAPPTATRTGYDFAGWYTAASGGTNFTNSLNGTVDIANDMTLYAHWTPRYNGVTLTKKDADGVSPQGDAVLSGAVYSIVNNGCATTDAVTVNGTSYAAGKEVLTITTNADGVAATSGRPLPTSDYTITEETASTGYVRNTSYSSTAQVRNKDTTLTLAQCNESVIRGGVKIQKLDADSSTATPQGDAGKGNAGSRSFAGTTFVVVNQSANPVVIQDKNKEYRYAESQSTYAKGAPCLRLTLDANGTASCPADTLPYGTYQIYEAAAPDGYTIPSGWASPGQTFTIRTNGQMVSYTDSSAVRESVVRGGLHIQKVDSDWKTASTQGGAASTFEGTTYQVFNVSEHPVYVGSTSYAGGDTACAHPILTIKADSTGAAKTASDQTLPYGTYIVKETAAVTGYLIDPTWGTMGIEFTIRQNGSAGTVVNLTSDTTRNADPVIRGGVRVQKGDLDWKTNQTQGDANATFEGTQWSIYNLSAHGVYVDGKTWAANDRTNPVKVITANASGVAETGATSLPYGTYLIRETKAADGYLIDATWKDGIEFSITRSGEVIHYDDTVSGSDTRNLDSVIRGDVRIQKADADWKTNQTQGDAGDPADADESAGGKATFEGVTWSVYNLSPHAVYVNGQTYAGNDTTFEHPVVVLHADASGMAQTTGKALPYGTYAVIETQAATGYLVGSGWDDGSTRFSIRSDGQVVHYDDTVSGSDTRNLDPVIRGGLEVHKYDTDSGENVPQGDAGDEAGTFAGTTYWVTNCSRHAVYIPTPESGGSYSLYTPGKNTYAPGETCVVVKADAEGVATIPRHTLPYGTYRIAEVMPPTGYMNSSWGTWMVPVNPDADPAEREYVQWTFTIRTNDDYHVFDDETNANGLVRNEEPVMRGGVAVKKVDADWLTSDTQGDAADTFEGAGEQRTTYEIYNVSRSYVYVYGERYEPNDPDPVITIYADASGVATTGNNILPYGSYVIKETAAVEGYLIDPKWAEGIRFSIDGQGFMKYFGSIDIAPNDQDDLVGDDGSVTPASQVVGEFNADPVIRGSIEIHKYDRDLLAHDVAGDGATQGGAESFAGTRYVVTSLSSHKVRIRPSAGAVGTDYDYDERCYYLTAGADGVARMNEDALPYGTYEVMELSPAPGYQNSYWRKTFQIREDGKVVVFDSEDESDDAPTRNVDEIDRGSVTVAKVDAETGLAEPQGSASLAGAEYEIVNLSPRPVVVAGRVVASGEVAATITSKASGLATTGSAVLPYGSYSIRETKAPYGYEVNSSWSQTFRIDHQGHDVAFIYDGNKNREPLVRMGESVRVSKVDSSWGTDGAGDGSTSPATSGAATLSGAVFAVRNASDAAVVVNGEKKARGEVVMTLPATDASGSTWIVSGALPVGTYEITEETAPEGYLRDSSWKADLEVKGDGTLSATEVVCQDPVIRGDLKFRKVVAGTSRPIPGVAFRITSATTGESHVAVTDESGLLDTSSAAASRTTGTVNANDAALGYDNVSRTWSLDASVASAANGIWFSGRDGEAGQPSDAVGALPYDTYEVEELRCDANRDYDLVPPFSFTVSREGYALAAETVEDGIRTPPSVSGEHGSRVTVYKDAAADHPLGSKVVPGDVITYEVTVRNTGASPVAWSRVCDPLPEGTEYVPASASDGGAYVVPANGQAYVCWKVASLAPREERTLTFKAKVLYDAPQFVGNIARVAEMPGDFDPADATLALPSDESNTAWHRTGASDAPASVMARLTSDPAPGTQIAWNREVVYTITLTNTGGTTALMTGVHMPIPYGTELLDAGGEAGYVTSWDDGYVSALVPTLAPGETVSIPVRVKVTDHDAVRALSTVTAQASWGDLSALDSPEPPASDLSNTTNIVEHPLYEAPTQTSDTYKTASPAAESVVAAGDVITYTLTTTNTLASAKPHTLIRDYIPEGTDYKDGSATDGGVYVAADAEGNATGRAYVEWVLPALEPRATKAVSFSCVVRDGWASYVRNVAYAQATQDGLMAGDTSNPEPATRTNETKHRLPAGTKTEDKFPLVRITKSADPASGSTVIQGQTVTYSLDVANDGGATAYDVMVFDPAPTGTSVVLVDGSEEHTLPSQGAGAGWLIRELAPGKSVRLTFAVKVEGDASSIDGAMIRSQARWSYANEPDEYEDWLEPPLSDEGMTDATNVVEHLVAATAGTQQGSLVTCYVTSDPEPNSVVSEGDEVTYVIRAVNTGSETQAATLIRNHIPEGMEYVQGSATDGGVYVSADKSPDGRAYVEWVIGALAPLEETRVSFAATVSDGYRTYLSDVAEFSRTSKDMRAGDPSNPAPEEGTNVVWLTTDEAKQTPAAVYVTKACTPTSGGTVTRDDTIRYVLTVTNSGGEEATSFGVWDRVPDGVEVVDGSVSEEFAGTLMAPDGQDPYVAWLVPSLASGKSVELSFEARLREGTLEDVIRNQATWGEAEALPESALANTSNVVALTVERNAAPSVSKSVEGASRVSVGGEVAFSLRVANAGDAAMSGWTLTDAMPSELQYLSDDGNGIVREDGSVVWKMDLEPGQERVIKVKARAQAPTALGGGSNVAVLEDAAGSQVGTSPAGFVVATPEQLLQTGVGTVAGFVGMASGALLAYDVVQRRRRQA